MIQKLIHIFDKLGSKQEHIAKSKDPLAQINTNLIKSTKARIAKLVDNINDIIKSLPKNQRLTKRMIGEIFGAVGTLMGIFNSWEISQIAKGVGENSKVIKAINAINFYNDYFSN